MNRKLMLGIAAFLAVVVIALTGGENEVQAGFGCGGGLFARHHGCGGAVRGCGGRRHGGLFAKHRRGCGGCAGVVAPTCGGAPDCGGCGGGLFARLKAKHAARRAARGCCGVPDPCCGPAPTPVCAPAPEPCCAPAPEPCCAAPVAAPCCGTVEVAAPVAAAPCCGVTGGPVMEGVPTEAPVNDAGEQIVPGSVQVISDGAEAAASASDAADGI